MNKDTNNIWNAYKLINEISKRDMDLVRYDRPVEELPFDNIFGDKLRIVLPISLGEESDSKFDILLDRIKQFFDSDNRKEKFPNMIKFVRFDYKTKKAVVKLQTQMGEKDREETLASLFDKMFKSGYINKAYRDDNIKWIEQNIAQLLPSSYVVISRSVVDNLRMSDISGIQSCHSPGGGYYSSCLSEAAGGGVIAFVIDGGELEKKQIENIETDEEIFSDKDRSVEGLEATYRLRMRKYYAPDDGSEDGEEVGYFILPERKVYKKSTSKGIGNSVRVPGLVEVVTDFLKSKQNLNKENILKLFTNKDIIRKGGSYGDSDDHYLFNQYFGGSDFNGYIRHEEEEIDEDAAAQAENERRYDQFEQELGHFLRDSGVTEAQHVSSSYNVEMTDDGDVYYDAYGGISINIEDIDLEDYDGTPDELNDLERDDVSDVVKGNKMYEWQKITERKTKYYRILFNELNKVGVDNDEIQGFSYTRNGYTIIIQANLVDYDFNNGSTSHDVDNYPHFLQTLMEWNRKYDKIKTAVIRALSIAGYTELSENQKIQYGLGDYDENKKEFSTYHNYIKEHKYAPKHLKFEGDWATFMVQTGINSNYLYNLEFDGWQGKDKQVKRKIHVDIKTALTKYLEDTIHIHSKEYGDEYQNELKQKKLNIENYNFDLSFGMYSKDRNWIRFNMTLEDATKRSSPDNNALVYKVSFEAEEKNIYIIQGIDSGMDDVKNIIKGCFLKNIVPEDKYTSYDRNILRTYSIYLNHVNPWI